mgnify:CR=1 FL=1
MEISEQSKTEDHKINDPKPLKISLYFAHDYVESELVLKDKNVVVIDVLRTSTTMITGLSNGAKEIIPTDSIASAGMIGRNSDGWAFTRLATDGSWAMSRTARWFLKAIRAV